MCNAPRDIAPCGHALCRDQIADIIKCNHISLNRAITAPPHRDAHQKRLLRPITGEAQFLLQRIAAPFPQARGQISKFRHKRRQGTVMVQFIFRQAQKPLRRAVDKLNIALCCDTNHASRNRPKHTIKEASLPLGSIILFNQTIALRLQLQGHLVEHAAKRCDFIAAFFFRHARLKITFTDPFGGGGQTPHRTRQTFGKPQPQPNGRHDHNQRKANIEQAKFE